MKWNGRCVPSAGDVGGGRRSVMSDGVVRMKNLPGRNGTGNGADAADACYSDDAVAGQIVRMVAARRTHLPVFRFVAIVAHQIVGTVVTNALAQSYSNQQINIKNQPFEF